MYCFKRIYIKVKVRVYNAVDAAKEEGLYTNDAEVVVIETTLDEFSEA